MARRRRNAPAAKSAGIPKWVIIGGIGLVAFYLISRNSAQASMYGSTTSPYIKMIGGRLVDTRTGLPVTGQQAGTLSPLTGEQSLIMAGISQISNIFGKLLGSGNNAPGSVVNQTQPVIAGSGYTPIWEGESPISSGEGYSWQSENIVEVPEGTVFDFGDNGSSDVGDIGDFSTPSFDFDFQDSLNEVYS